MELEQLRTNHLGAQAWAWYQRYLAALDAFDLDTYQSLLADDVILQFNNDDPMRGKQEVAAGLGGYWQMLAQSGFRLTHAPLNVYGADDAFVLEALNHYDHSEHGRITIRAAAFTDRDATGQVTSIRVYQDVGPVMQASGR